MAIDKKKKKQCNSNYGCDNERKQEKEFVLNNLFIFSYANVSYYEYIRWSK